MVKKIILSGFAVFLIAVILFACREAGSNNPLFVIRSNDLQNKLSSDGNMLIFRVSYLGLIPAGKAMFENKGEELYQGRKVYHLSATASPLDFYSNMFNVQAQVDSFMDAEKFHTLKFKQTLTLPNKPKDEKEVLYDQENNFMELKGVKRQILPGTHDPLSAIFYIRHQDLEVGKTLDLNINTNQKNYQFYAKVIGKEEYALKGAKVGVWVLEIIIRRRDKNPYHKTTLKLWLLDAPSKIPIFIKAMTNIGQVTARLTAVE